MHLQGQIAAFNGVEEIKSDGKFSAELANDICAQQRLRILVNEHQCRHFKHPRAKLQSQAVLFGYAVKAPRIIRWAIGKVEFAPHPLAAPGTRIEKWNQAEGLLSDCGKRRPHRLTAKHRRLFWSVAVDPEVDPIVDFVSLLVGRPPIKEKCAFVKLSGRSGRICQS